MAYDPFAPSRDTLLLGFFNYPNALGRYSPYLGGGEAALPLSVAAGAQAGQILFPYSIRITRFWERQRYRVGASGIATAAYLQIAGVDLVTLSKAAGDFDSTSANLSLTVTAGTLIGVQWEQLALGAGGYAPCQGIDFEKLVP